MVELAALEFPVAFIATEELSIEFALTFAVVFAVVFDSGISVVEFADASALASGAIVVAVALVSAASLFDVVLTATPGAVVVRFAAELTAASRVVAFERPKKAAVVVLAEGGASVAVESPPHPDKTMANADIKATVMAPTHFMVAEKVSAFTK